MRRSLEHEYAGWRVVTEDSLSSEDDREIWARNFSGECPGIAVGRFKGKGLDYAINLIRNTGASLEQQLILFEHTEQGFNTSILFAPSAVGVVSVIRKFGPGIYRSPDSGRPVRIQFDTIGVSEIEGGAVVYYWTGKRFEQIVTSV
ncbi:MAG TPA: hypothetical protein VFL36_19195 [Myxococcales bacterium]|nr:hypothetical protein [Myxococcales bacterium]